MSADALHVEVDGDGPQLVVLHGGGGGGSDLVALRTLLGSGRQIIAPDQRGQGRSPDLGELTYEAMTADTAEVLAGLGVRGADVLGWSDGGVIALRLARDHPNVVRRVVAVSANVSWEPPAPAAVRPEALASLETAGLESFPLPVGRAELPGAVEAWPGIVARIKVMWRADPGISMTDLSRLTRPVLYVAGDRDLIRTEHTVAMFESTSDAWLAIVPGATHEVPMTHAAEVAGIVERFLRAAVIASPV